MGSQIITSTDSFQKVPAGIMYTLQDKTLYGSVFGETFSQGLEHGKDVNKDGLVDCAEAYSWAISDEAPTFYFYKEKRITPKHVVTRKVFFTASQLKPQLWIQKDE